MKADCQHFDAFAAGALSPDAARRFEVHLAGCAACAAEMSRQRELDRLLVLAKDCPEPVPSRLRERVEGILADDDGRSRWRWGRLRYIPLATAAGLVLAMMGLWSLRPTLDMPSIARHAEVPPVSVVVESPAPAPPAPAPALAKLAIFATERRKSAIGPEPEGLFAPSFVDAGQRALAPPVRPSKADRKKAPEVVDRHDERDEVKKKPKRVAVPRFNAASIHSATTMGERKLNQSVLDVPFREKKENIPC